MRNMCPSAFSNCRHHSHNFHTYTHKHLHTHMDIYISIPIYLPIFLQLPIYIYICTHKHRHTVHTNIVNSYFYLHISISINTNMVGTEMSWRHFSSIKTLFPSTMSHESGVCYCRVLKTIGYQTNKEQAVLCTEFESTDHKAA